MMQVLSTCEQNDEPHI